MVTGGYEKRWRGQRVELNALTSSQFITWLEAKLNEHGLTRYIPANDILALAYRQAGRYAAIQKEIDWFLSETGGDSSVPADLRQAVEAELAKDSNQSWDNAIFNLAREKALVA